MDNSLMTTGDYPQAVRNSSSQKTINNKKVLTFDSAAFCFAHKNIKETDKYVQILMIIALEDLCL